MSCCGWKQGFLRMFLLRNIMSKTFCLLKREMSLTERHPRNDQKTKLFSTYTFWFPSILIHLCLETLLSFTLGSPHSQNSLTSFLLLLTLVLISSVRTLWIVREHHVITWALCAPSYFPDLITILFYKGKETQDIRHQWEIGTMDIGEPMTVY